MELLRLTTAALFVQRHRETRAGPCGSSDYRTPLYPLTPVLFILVTVAIIASDLSTRAGGRRRA